MVAFNSMSSGSATPNLDQYLQWLNSTSHVKSIYYFSRILAWGNILRCGSNSFDHSMILLAHFESALDKAVPIFGNFVIEQTFDRWRICLILHRISVGLFDSLPAFSPGEKAPNVGIYWILCLDSILFFSIAIFSPSQLWVKRVWREPLKNLHSWLADLNLASTTYCFI